MKSVVVEQEVLAPLEKVQKLIWDIEAWAHFWAPLYEVRVQYDDGMHQDFQMALDWQNKETTIRTVRFRKLDGEICFFSPQPPPPTLVHIGSWRFISQKIGSVKLIATREFQLSDSIDINGFSSDFTKRLKNLLEKLRVACER